VPSSVKPRALCGKYFGFGFGFVFIFLHEQRLIQSAQDFHTKSFTIEQLDLLSHGNGLPTTNDLRRFDAHRLSRLLFRN
jgi:hypothetical protein